MEPTFIEKAMKRPNGGKKPKPGGPSPRKDPVRPYWWPILEPCDDPREFDGGANA